MRTEGNATAYTGGTTHRPLPAVDLTYRPSAPVEGWACPTEGCEFTARRKTFHLCVTAPAPTTKSGRVLSVTELTEEELAMKFTPDEPVPDTPRKPPSKLANLQFGVPVGAPMPKPRVRAKVVAAKPGPGVLIGLSGVVSTVEVTALLTGLLEALNGVGHAARKPVTIRKRQSTDPKPVSRQTSAPTASARGRSGGVGNSTGKLAGKDAAIIRRYRAGEPPRAIAADYDCSDMAIRFLLKRNGVTLRSAGEAQRGTARPGMRALSAEQAAECARLYVEEGMSMLKLAARFGISENGVRTTLKRLEVPIRPGGKRSVPSASGGAR